MMSMGSRRAKAAGLTLIEVMISAAVLGFGVMALAKVYTHTVRGMGSARHQGEAQQIALQRVEQLMGMGADHLPGCGVVPAGCRQTMSTYAAGKGADAGGVQCTQRVDGPDLPALTDVNAAGRYRIDTLVEAPGGANQQAGGQLVTVSVCWENGDTIQQVQVRRILLPGV